MVETRALIVCYSFPPVGGAGVQRMAKLVKYLPDHQVRPAVLTVSNPSVPLRDDSLLADLPPDLEVLRARTFEPSYAAKQAAWTAEAERDGGWRRRLLSAAVGQAKRVLVPDPQVLWQPAAQLRLRQRLRHKRDDVMLISAPPFSQFMLATAAAIPVILDYRDEWSTARQTFEMLRGGLNAALSDRLEEALLRRAYAVTVATDAYRDNLLRRYPFLDPGRVVAIPNGYDSDDLPAALPEPPSDKLVLCYAGTIFKLTSARGLLDALRRLHAREPELAKRLEVRFYGRIVDTELDAFEGSEALGVRRMGYVPHAEVLSRLCEGHWMLCLLDDVDGCERIYPAKIFELMMLERPVLTLAPRGVLRQLAERHHLGCAFEPRDAEGISAWLARELRHFAEDPRSARAMLADRARGRSGIEQYHRRALAGRFAELMRDAARGLR